MFGYSGKMLFVDLTTGAMEDRVLEEDMAKDFLGGPGLGARILYECMPANTDPFSEDSMVGFVCGPMNNTGGLFGGRYTVVSKSPVTGGWNDANSGGYFAPALKRAGYDAVFIRGIAEKPVYIYIENGKPEICDASEMWGMTTKETEAFVAERYGKDAHVALIGPGGERQALMACIMNDEHRAAGRGGSGAVIGSKKLKALIVKGNIPTEVADRARMIELNRAIADFMKNGDGKAQVDFMGVYGTGGGYVNSVLTSDAGIKNWTGSHVDYPEEVAFPVGSVGIDKYKKKKYNCVNCPLGCGAIMDIPSDKYDLKDAPRPEYETQGAFGSLMLNSDVASVAQCNNLCNEYGVDTISTGSTIAWAMEAYNEGALTKEDLDGIELNWGDPDAIVAICEKICKGEGCGAILQHGSREASRIYGKGEKYLVTASGIEEPQHDSRLNVGLARTYRFDPTPGRHVKGGMYGPLPPDPDFTELAQADVAAVANTEITNSGGFCLFGGGCCPPDSYQHLIEAATGFSWTPEEFKTLGLRMFVMRHAFNLREGMDRDDFTLSKRYVEADPPFDGPIKGVKIPAEEMADKFFEAMHFDKQTLIPEKEFLEELGGLDIVIDDLYK
ncbi:MAG: aldehyde ferredoxin oxidoreductase family protein [Erysipelotrichaceae bacterium]|nr:aldehyde ferredoxin oxidoreductase family protein [Erysipelotrichaceae bacterium]